MLGIIFNKFTKLRNYSNYVGAFDEKNIRTKALKNSEYHYFNHKKFYSTIMLSSVNSNNKFVSVDLGHTEKKMMQVRYLILFSTNFRRLQKIYC